MSSGAGLSKARRKLGTVGRSLRLTRKGTLSTSNTGLTEAAAEVRGATSRMRDLRKPLSLGALDIEKLIVNSFANETDPGGTPWKELSEEYEWAKALNIVLGRHRGRKQKTIKADRKIMGAMRVPGALSRQKDLKRARTQREKALDTQKRHSKMTRKQSERASKLVGKMKILVDRGLMIRSWKAKAGKTSIMVSTNKSYAKYHQAGGDTIPARPMAPVELVNGQWKLINRGPAKLVFDRLGKAIMDYVAPEVK